MKSPRECARIRRLRLFLTILLVLSAAGICIAVRTDLKMHPPAPESESTEVNTAETESSSDSGSDKESETESGTEPGSEAENETEVVSETETAEASSEKASEETEGTYGYWFGKRMNGRLLEINQKTLSDPGSKLADLLSERQYTAADVLNMIGTYRFPDKNRYGDRQDIQNVQDELSAYMNLNVLQEKNALDPAGALTVCCGILAENASVRAFPTDLCAHDEGDSAVWDYFQETELLYGDGVLVLHETADGLWSFVQGLNYFGWVRTSTIAFCEREVFREFLAQDQFLVRTAVLYGDPAPVNRLGVILPVKGKAEDGSAYTVILPERSGDGSLVFRELEISGEELSAYYHEGFLEYSPEEVLNEARKLLGYPYGYGDLNNRYDCSSFAGLVYRCFGIFTPRNSGDMPHAAGLAAADVRGLSDSEKAWLVKEHPGAIIGWPGHVMLSAGADSLGRAWIIHCNTAYYSAPDGDPAHYIVTEKVLEAPAAEIYGANGASFLSKLEYVIWPEMPGPAE